MKIVVAKTAGFCMGVRRAVELALDAPSRNTEPIYTYGPLIHNPQVLELFAEKGIAVLDHIPEQGSGTVLIRAHGVPPQVKEDLKRAGFQVIDATCPRVIKVQTIIRVHARKGFASIIVGDRDHPEVVGLLGYAGNDGYVVGSLAELARLPAFDQAIVVAQTTQSTAFFRQVKVHIEENFPHYKVFDTICDSTARRQEEARCLSEQVDAVVVVGGRASGNTRRLAEIVELTGKPTWHVETEEELDLERLSGVRSIGITAGASTPNWITKRVLRTLEALPLRRSAGWGGLSFAMLRGLRLTNAYVAVGAGSLCYASSMLQGLETHFRQVLIAFLYVLSMHTLNHLTGTHADRYNDPERANFYRRHRNALGVLAVGAGALGLFAAYAQGRVPFTLLLGMSVLGLSYNSTLVPAALRGAFKYRRIRDIPGSKTILITAAWGVVTSILPALAVGGRVAAAGALVCFWSMCMVFVRTVFFDILDMQGDRIVGKETIALWLGEKRSLRLLKQLLLVIAATLLLATAVGLIPGLGVMLTLSPLFVAVVLLAYEKGSIQPGVRLEFLVDTHFVLAGMVTVLWTLVVG